LNTPSPIVEIPSPIITCVKASQFANALFPIVVTELGIVNSISFLQPSKALSPIVETLLPIITLFILQHLYAPFLI
jgi:hypothetical protein